MVLSIEKVGAEFFALFCSHQENYAKIMHQNHADVFDRIRPIFIVITPPQITCVQHLGERNEGKKYVSQKTGLSPIPLTDSLLWAILIVDLQICICGNNKREISPTWR
jgi:hypothetical protein